MQDNTNLLLVGGLILVVGAIFLFKSKGPEPEKQALNQVQILILVPFLLPLPLPHHLSLTQLRQRKLLYPIWKIFQSFFQPL